MKAKSLAFLISFVLPGSAYAAQCNQEAWTQAKLRCVNLSDPQQCNQRGKIVERMLNPVVLRLS